MNSALPESPEPSTGEQPIADISPRWGFGRNVIALGWVSLLTDVASEMLYPVMPLFLVNTLGSSPAILGLVDGVAEGISSGLRWIGGALSDRFGQRKPFVVAGYALSALSKPIMGAAAFAWGWPLFLVGRSSDRLGKSIRTSARDALIAESTPADRRGAAFGLHRAMDTSGAVIGPLLAVAILAIWPKLPLQWLFFIALAPGIFSVMVAQAAVREIRPQADKEKPKHQQSMFQSFPPAFWHLIVANALFSLGNSSDSFLILRSSNLGMTFTHVVLAYVVYNVVYAAGSLPLGRLSDSVGRKGVIAAGWLIYAAVYLGFAMTGSIGTVWALFAAYGLYQALTDGVTKAMVSDVVPKHKLAGAIGLFSTVNGVGQFAASLIAGSLWKVYLPHSHVLVALGFGAACAIAAVPVVLTVRMKRSD